MAGLLFRLRNLEVKLLHLTQRSQRRTQIFRISNGHDGEIGRLQVLLGYAQHIRFGDGVDGLLVLEQEVLGIAVVLVRDQTIQRFGRTVKTEYEPVQNCILRSAQFLIRHFGRANLLHFFPDHLDRIHGRQPISCWR